MSNNIPVINNLSDKLEKLVTNRFNELGSIVEFRTLRTSSIPSKDEAGVVRVLTQPTSAALRGSCKITDPETKKQITIGVSTGFDTVRSDWNYAFKLLDGFKDGGILKLVKGVDDEWIKFLLMADYVEGAVVESKNTVKKIRLVDPLASARESNKRRDTKLEAMKVAHIMKDDQIRGFIASLNQDDNADIEILRDKVKEMAELHPDTFVKLYNDTDRDVKATIRRAIDMGVIEVDPTTNGIILSSTKQPLVQLHMMEGQDILTQFVSYKNATGPKAEAVYKLIQDAMKKERGGAATKD